MLRNRFWGEVLAFGALATLLATLAGCGGATPATQPPDEQPRVDAGQPVGGADAGVPDGGENDTTDGGKPAEVRSLTVIGNATPMVLFEETLKLQVIFLSSETGVIADAPVSFSVLSGAGKVEKATVSTDGAGIARVVFTAGTVPEVVRVAATVDGAGSRGRVEWAISVREPERVLRREGGPSARLELGKTVTIGVKLTQNTRPIAGAAVKFEATNARGGMLIDDLNINSKVVTTAIDGTARVQLSLKDAPAALRVLLSASADYAAPVDFSIDVPAYGDCQDSSQCITGEVCNDEFRCVEKTGCASDADCAAGSVCAAGQCVVPIGGTTCTSTHPDCDAVPGSYCNTALGKCVAGCDEDAQCTAPMICDPARNRCSHPTSVGCSDDSDCPSGYRCDGSACVLAPPNSTNCSDSSECPTGQYCNAGLAKCVAGCDEDWQCDTTCDRTTHQCAPPPECYDDSDCTAPEVCDLAVGQCVQPPPVIFDVTTDWDNVVQIFHVESLLPQSFLDVFGRIDQAMTIAQTIVSGRVGDLLPSAIPDFLKDKISDAVEKAIGSNVPDWVVNAIHIGSDVMTMAKNFEIRSKMSFQQGPPATADLYHVKGTDTWKTIVFYWYTASCPPPAPGHPPDACALVEIDLASALIAPAPSNFTGTIDNSTLNIQTHNISFQYGKAVKVLLEMLLEQLTGYPTIRDALTATVNCSSINDWVKDVAHSFLDSWGLGDLADDIDLTGACTTQVNKAATEVTNYITQLTLTTNFALEGRVAIQQEPGNTSNVADKLVNGIWTGTMNGKAPANGKPLADWYADRY